MSATRRWAAVTIGAAVIAASLGVGTPALADDPTPTPTATDTPTPSPTVLPELPAGRVAVQGDLVVGATLTAVPTNWPAGTTFTYIWWRISNPGQGGVDHATGPSITLTEDDRVCIWVVTVTGTLAGYAPSTADGATDGAVPYGQFAKVYRPIITGRLRVGSVLTATLPAWQPAATTLLYQWRRAGFNIDGAYGPTYRLTKADRGHRISVVITGKRDNYRDRYATSYGRKLH